MYKRYEKYFDLEKQIVNIVKKQDNTYKNNLSNKLIASAIVVSDDITSSDLKVNNDSCINYVKVDKVFFIYSYKAYIKCNDYKTKGY